jgi:hypothetical protein
MQANPRNLNVIFAAQCRYLVPLFQRQYVWKRVEQWEPLWEDVQAVAERYLKGNNFQPHFMGAVVLEQMTTPTGMLDVRQIIDGQQRLITLQLLVAAARDVSRSLEIPTEQHYRNFELLTVNSMASDHPEEVFKVWPTNRDREQFQLVMTSGSAAKVRAWCQAKKAVQKEDCLIPEAYLYFYDRIKEWLETSEADQRSKYLDALQYTVYQGLVLVAIDLDDKDNAQIIFETLNARGTPLLAADLVKNYLLHLADSSGLPVEQLYNRYWSAFDGARFWSQIVSQGRLYRPRIELFLQHYLTLATADEVPAGSLFVTFRQHVKTNKDKGPEDHLSSLRRYGDIFKNFYDQPLDTREGLFFYRIEVMDTTTVFPFLLYVFDRLGDSENATERLAVLTDLESYLVRRMICGLTTKNYNRLFLDLRTHLESNGGNLLAGMRQFLLSQEGDSGRWPDDFELYKAWKGEPIYKRITRARLRMILEALEMELHTDKTERVPLPKKLTIEHLMPQGWKDNWPLPVGDPDAETKRESMIHTFGNLTLVTKSLNSSLSNGPWAQKRDFILQHSALNLNRQFHKIDAWDEDQIDKRGMHLYNAATQIWPQPK